MAVAVGEWERCGSSYFAKHELYHMQWGEQDLSTKRHVLALQALSHLSLIQHAKQTARQCSSCASHIIWCSFSVLQLAPDRAHRE